jgi:predicted nucleotidyltransferase
MTEKIHIELPKERIEEFCKKHHIRKLSLFGSALRDDFTPESDLDILVEFEPGTRVGMIRLAGLEIELGEILGRKVDLNTPGFLSKYYRDKVLAEAAVHYDAA